MTNHTDAVPTQQPTGSVAPLTVAVPELAATKRGRRMARPAGATSDPTNGRPAGPSKLDQIAAMVSRSDGATITELTAATGWQPHSVRGAIAGALKKREMVITSAVVDQVRRYRAEPTT